MIVHFGLQLGGMQAARPAAPAGETVLGPSRLLDVLETELGLPPAQARPAEALLAYQACLAELDDPARFYHRSFAVDALAVARALLRWRAEWHEAGWRGRFGGKVSPRLADMAAVERLAAERVPLDAGQRLARVAAALERGYGTQIERVVLHDEPAALPAAWRAVLDRFPCELAAGVDPAPAAPRATDLGRVQRALRDAPSDKIALAGDDSLILLRGVSRDLTAQAIGEFLLGAGGLERSVVIAERDGIIVDNAFERVGLPRAGFQHYSPFRAVTQLPLLCLGLLWQPLDVHLLLQFLLHPVGPLPSFARARLAAAVAAEPGIGGSAWREALAAIEARAGERPGADSRGQDAAAIVADIRYWLECERYAPADGAPVEVLMQRTARLASWLRRRHNALADAGEQVLYRNAAAESEALLAALESLAARGTPRVERIALEQLIGEVAGAAPDPASFAQAGHVPATTSPATITSPWQTVVWWDLTAPPARAAAPWSAEELAELAGEGVALAPARARIHHQTRAWRRPVLNAAAKLILVLHERDEARHPLLGQLENVAAGLRQMDVEDALLAGAGGAPLAALGIRPEPLAPRPLPAPRRWWSLPAECRLEPRPAESYTSLAKLIDYPHEWVLRYAADLQPGRAANLTGGALLYGKLAHRLFQLFFTEHPDWASLDAAAVARWRERTLPRLIEQEGALLLEPGMGVARELVAATLENALERLLEHFERAGIERVLAEQWIDAPCGAIPPPRGAETAVLRGAIDLALTDRRGREIVLDVKWSGEERRGAELAQNRHLQLASYAYLRKAALERTDWPQQAYFIVTTGNVLAQDTAVFPDAVPFPPADEGGLDALWPRVAASVAWRWRQLGAGLIEVNAPGTEPDGRSAPPAAALAPEERPDRYDDFVRLTGWEPGQ
jgi:hypothetical protein